jgi:hypothetical protein
VYPQPQSLSEGPRNHSINLSQSQQFEGEFTLHPLTMSSSSSALSLASATSRSLGIGLEGSCYPRTIQHVYLHTHTDGLKRRRSTRQFAMQEPVQLGRSCVLASAMENLYDAIALAGITHHDLAPLLTSTLRSELKSRVHYCTCAIFTPRLSNASSSASSTAR